jgi:hypothetical protein
MMKKLLLSKSLFLKFSDYSSKKTSNSGLKFLCLGMFFIYSMNYGQSASSYCFTGSTEPYISLTGATSANGMPAAATDDAISTTITIPFTFTFGAAEYTQIKISNNGWLTFGATADSQYDNTLANAESSKPILFPFWDDLRYSTNNQPKYITTGTTPNRIFKAEWIQQFFFSGGSGDAISFQVWLYEGSNKIEYRYKQGSATPGAITASIGIFDSNSTYLTLNNATANPTAQTSTFNTSINTRPLSDQVYTFTPPAPSTLAGSISFCQDFTNTQTASVKAGQYVLVDVIKGYKYTFSIPDVFSAFNENLTILDASNKNLSPPYNATGPNGTSIVWPASFSGQIKVLLSSSCANSGATGGTMTLVQNSIGNTLDLPTAAGTNTWIGHIYNAGGATPEPFTDATKYAGNYTIPTETFDTDFGGNAACIPVFSNGVQRASMYAEGFAVRYRMNSTREAGCYFIKITGDDGVRLSINNNATPVFNRWQEQGATTYDYVLVNLPANPTFTLDYYENAGDNRVSFDIKKFDPTANKIYDQATNTTTVNFCNGGTPGIIGGSFQYNSGDETMPNPYINFLWYVSTNGGTSYSLAPGTNNLRTYTPQALGTNNTTSDVVYLYKRIATINTSTVPGASCTFAESNIVTITNSPAVVITSQPQPLIVCEGQTGSFTVATSNTNATYQWQYASNTAGPWTNTNPITELAGHNTNKLTISNAPLGYNNFYLRCVITNGACSLPSSTPQLTVNPTPSIPTVVTSKNISCTLAKGSVDLSGLPSGSWTITQSGTTGATINGSGTTYTVSNLSSGNYQFSVRSGNCTSNLTNNVIISDQSSTTWDGSTWSAGLPDATKNVIFTSTYLITSDMSACACTVNSGVHIIVPSGKTLNVKNAVTVLGTGSLTFNNTASLVQDPNTTVNSNVGSIIYKRNTAPVRQRDFTYWSAPVSNFTLFNLSPNTEYRMYRRYEPTTGWVSIYNGTATMTPGVGYIVRAPETNSATVGSVYPASFVGVPNNGDVTVTPVAALWNLVGNPYPSALDAVKFIKANTAGANPTIVGTLYFWTHNTLPAFNDPTQPNRYFYTTDDYAVFNLSGTIATGFITTSTEAPSDKNSANNAPTGNIASGQGFFLKALTTNPIIFNNSMRVVGADNSQFFKTTNSNETKDRLWLNFTNEKGAFKQLLVGYFDGATNTWDNNYDATTFSVNPYIDFYSIDETRKLTIQGRAVPFENTDLVPLGYKSTIAGEFTISIDHVEGLFNQQAIYLEDKTTGIIHNLNTKDYIFNTETGTFPDRFVLRYTNKTLGTGDFENIEDGILISVKNKVINIISSKENIKEITIFDITGKTLYNKTKVSNTELQIQNLPSRNQVLLVKVTLDNDFTTTRKIIFQ